MAQFKPHLQSRRIWFVKRFNVPTCVNVKVGQSAIPTSLFNFKQLFLYFILLYLIFDHSVILLQLIFVSIVIAEYSQLSITIIIKFVAILYLLIDLSVC